MVLSPLETLPFLVLDSVCGYLAHSEPSGINTRRKRNLLAFLMASKTCYAVADRQRFGTVHITMRNSTILKDDVRRWNEILGVGDRKRFVRRLEIGGGMDMTHYGQGKGQRSSSSEDYEDGAEDSDGDDSVDNDNDDGNGETSENDDKEEVENVQRGYGSDDEEMSTDDDEPFWKPTKEMRNLSFHPSPLPLEGKERQGWNEAWTPLALFLAWLPALKDLEFKCTDQVPICIISTLHQRHPKCRLHVSGFDLRSMHQEGDDQHDIDPDELALVTSPCLYSIDVFCSGFNPGDQRVNYTQEVVLTMMATPQMRLKNVRFHMLIFYRGAFSRVKPPWRGFLVDDSTSEQQPLPPSSNLTGTVQNLALTGFTSSPGQFTTLSKHTDFSELRTLQLEFEDGLSIGDLRTLTRLAHEIGFKSLHTLSLSLPIPDYRCLDAPLTDDTTVLFLQALPPLKAVRLSHLVGHKAFAAVLHYHGNSVQKFHFLPHRSYQMLDDLPHLIISERNIEQFVQFCPKLEDVKLIVHRTRGDERELVIYKALGRIPRLKRVSLLFEYAGHAHASPLGLWTSVLKDKREYICDGFVNAAIDSSLALSIFQAISDSNNKSLELKLQLYEGSCISPYFYNEPTLHRFLCWIGRKWVCTRSVPGAEVTARELDRHKRLSVGISLKEDPSDQVATYKRIWRDIWPESKSESSGEITDWRHDWHSFLLAGAI